MKALGAASLPLLPGIPMLAQAAGGEYSNRTLGQEPASGPNFIIFVIDAFSARHVSLLCYPRRTTPHLDALAEKAIVYHRHYAPANFTSPGTASLLTGQLPLSHRATQFHSKLRPRRSPHTLFNFQAGRRIFAYTHNPMAYMHLDTLSGQIDALENPSGLSLWADSPAGRWFSDDYTAAFDAELLLFRNGAYPSGSLFYSLINRAARALKKRQINQAYAQQFPRGVPSYIDEEAPDFMYFTIEDAVDWTIAQVQDRSRPFLGYTHILPPHDPHTTRKEFYDLFLNDALKFPSKPPHFFQEGHSQEVLDLLRRYYDESLAYVDAEVGRLYEVLRSRGLLENTWLIITSDHGELFERGIYRHITPVLYEPVVRIPLLILPPGPFKRIDIHSPTSNIDLLPTIAHLSGIAFNTGVDGQVLPGIQLTGGGTQPEEPTRSIMLFEAKESPAMQPLKKATAAIAKGSHKLIYYTGYPGFDQVFEMYDLEADPEETNDLYEPGSPVARSLKDELLSFLAERSR